MGDGNPQQDLKNKGVIDSGCSRHMTGNRSYLTDYEEIDGGFVAFEGNSKGGKITGKGTLGHVNFKTMNKHVRGNLVRGLPSKLFEINQICVACQKGKQHRASCKTKTVSSISQPLQMLYMDLFGPTFVKSLMKKMYCLVVIDDFSRFSWVFFLATKDETSEILKTFITGIENLIDLRVKVIRCDNGTEFKNRVMNQFCEMKGIKREFSVARTPQQNGVAERKNRTLIEAARTMLADSKLPTTLWAEAVNTACYVQNRVLVIKPHNKTPYELFLGRKPALSFMRPFGCLVTILNTIDHLGKFDGKADEGFFVGYSTNSKAFRVFNSRTRIVEENLHVQFSENTPNIAGSGPNWLFDIDALTKSMNYKPVIAGNQSNGSTRTNVCDDAGKARMETVPGKDYILLPFWTADPPFSSSSKDSPDARFKPSGEDEKKDVEDPGNEDSKGPSTEDPRVNQEKYANINSTNTINIISSPVNTTSIEDNVVDENIVYGCADDPNMPELEDIIYSNDDEDVGAEVDMNNLDTFIPVSPIPTTRVHKDHPVEQIIGDLNSAPQTRRMTKKLEKHGLFSSVLQRTNHKDFQIACLLAFYHKKNPKSSSSTEGSKLDRRTKWVFRNKKDERGIVIKNKARLVAQGYTQEEGIDYGEVFTPVTRIEAIRLFLAYDSFKDFIEEEVYVCQPPGFEDPDFPNRVYKVEKALYGLHQAPRAWPDIMFAVCACARFQVNSKVSHLHVVKRIFKYLKGQLKLSLWYPKDSPLIWWHILTCKKQTVVSNSTTEAEYVAASSCCGQVLWIQTQLLDCGYNFMHTKIYIDNKSTICIVKNLVFHSKTKHIEIRHHFIRDSNENKLIQMIKIHTDKNVADLLTKAFDKGIEVNAGDSNLMLLGINLLLLEKVNAARYNLLLLVVR
ncbi:putative ribonuclease H-like domain-containing protein [Tanacetum coccineum]